MTIPDEKVETIRNAIDLPTIVAETWPEGLGDNICPFCRQFGFIVSREKRIYVCAKCGECGDVFHWLMKIGGMSWPEAVEDVRRRLAVASLISATATSSREYRLAAVRLALEEKQRIKQRAKDNDPVRTYLRKYGHTLPWHIRLRNWWRGIS